MDSLALSVRYGIPYIFERVFALLVDEKALLSIEANDIEKRQVEEVHSQLSPGLQAESYGSSGN